MKFKIVFAPCLFSLTFSMNSLACGPFFPNMYLVFGNESAVLDLSKLDYRTELLAIFQVGDPVNRSQSGWESTTAADENDLRNAIAGHGDTQANASLIERYTSMRKQMKIFFDGSEEYTYFHIDASEPLKEFDFTPYEETLSFLPEEFVLYLKGAAAYRSNRYEYAIRFWEDLLALPESKRNDRTSWAAFMMGKAWLRLDNPDKAIECFKRTRESIDEGFQDSLNLRHESLGWQAMAELRSERIHLAFQHYIEWFKNNPDERATTSLLQVSQYILDRNPIDVDVVNDPLCRKIVTAWVISGDYAPSAPAWLKAIEESNAILTTGEIGQFAWLSYKCGDFQKAKEWLSRTEERTPAARWVHSKILLRDGDIDKAVQILQSLIGSFPQDSGNILRAELGVLYLGREDYISALDTLARSGYWEDTTYIAERVLTSTELETYIEQHQDDPKLTKELIPARLWESPSFTALEGLKYLLARKLAREGKWDKAKQYHPVGEFDRYCQYARAGHDKNLSKRERAENIYEAAILMRQYGMEMFGTELEPDWSVFKGYYSLSGATENRIRNQSGNLPSQPVALVKVLSAGSKEKTRCAKQAPTPNQRFHYRYHAAELMWECAKLLPNNDPLTAKALYLGGRYSMDFNDYKYADKFYKALVKRCRKLPVGQKADEQRWFPEEAKDLFDPDSPPKPGRS